MVLQGPRKLLSLLVEGYAEESNTAEDCLAVELWHDVALVALERDWRAGKRLKMNQEGEIKAGTLQKFTASQLAWALVMFKYWTTPSDVAAPSTTTNQPLGQANQNQQAQEGSSRSKKKPIKVCVGDSQKNMLKEYRDLRKMLNDRKDATSAIDLANIAAGLNSWDLYMSAQDAATLKRRRGIGQENVDNGDEYQPGVPDDDTSGADSDLCFDSMLTHTPAQQAAHLLTQLQPTQQAEV